MLFIVVNMNWRVYRPMLGKKIETYFYNAKEKIFYPRPGCSNRIGEK